MNHNWFDWGVIQTFLWNKTLKGKGEFFRKTWKYFRILNILKRKNPTKPSKEKFGIGELKKMANYLIHQSLSPFFLGGWLELRCWICWIFTKSLFFSEKLRWTNYCITPVFFSEKNLKRRIFLWREEKRIWYFWRERTERSIERR